MNIVEEIRAALAGMTAVTAIVGDGSAARIRPDRPYQGESPPLIIVEIDSEDIENDLTGRADRVQFTATITCRDSSRSRARQLAEAVRTNGTDPGTGLAGYSGTFDAWLESIDDANAWRGTGGDEAFYDTILTFGGTYPQTR